MGRYELYTGIYINGVGRSSYFRSFVTVRQNKPQVTEVVSYQISIKYAYLCRKFTPEFGVMHPNPACLKNRHRIICMLMLFFVI